MTHPTPLLDAANDVLHRHIASGWTLESFLDSHTAWISPPRDGQPSTWITLGGTLYPDKDGGDGIKLKRHQIGVAFYYADCTSAHAIFDVRELWEEIVNPKPTQLPLWSEFG